MQHLRLLFAAFLVSGSAYAYADEPILLSDSQMDDVSAGVYSAVYGEASAGQGTTSVKTNVKAFEKPNGTQVSRGVVIVKAKGTDLNGFAAGESGSGDIVSGGYGQASVDEGRLRIRVVTIAKEKPNGEVISRTMVKVKAVSKT